jgi:prepilin-type N-terminal cleavage/methylation domain-containing protein
MRLKHIRTSAAFTLIEVLLAISLFGLIAATLFSVYHNGVMISRKGKAATQAQMEWMWALNAFRDDFQSAVPFVTDGWSIEFVPFDGQPDRVAFVMASEGALWWVQHYGRREDQDEVFATRLGVRSERNVRIETGETSDSDSGAEWVWLRSIQPLSTAVRGEAPEDVEILVRGLTVPPSWSFFKKNIQQDGVWVPDWQGDKHPQGVALKTSYHRDDELSMDIYHVFMNPSGVPDLQDGDP